MRIASLASAIALVGVLALAPPALGADGAEAVDAAWLSSMKANDLEGVLRNYADDATVWLPGMAELRGIAAIRPGYESMLKSHTVTAVSLTDAQYRSMGRLSVGWGRFSLTLTPKAGGAAAVTGGRFTTIAERREGRWVYLVDHASAEPPPAPATEVSRTP